MPFLATFFITWFVFLMQFFWLYIDDFVGKGMDISIILKLIGYLAPTLIPLALPLGILLAGIMTLGNLAESSELTAVKSSGNSLWTFLKPLLVLVTCISIGAYFLNNNLIPLANLKFYTLLGDVRNTKPAVNIKAGVFYGEIPGYSIYVNHKEADNKTINDIIIYDGVDGRGNDKVILAKKGKMYLSNDQKFLIFELSNGCRYEEKDNKNPNIHDQVRMEFKFWKKVFDLSSFGLKKSASDMLKGNEIMMTNNQLTLMLDSLDKRKKLVNNTNYKITTASYLAILQADSNNSKFANTTGKTYTTFIPKTMLDTTQKQIYSLAENNIRSLKGMLEVYASDFALQQTNMVNYKVEWHKKYVHAFSCLLLFLIGAPLGAIIRKGGFGLPFVSAVIFFVVDRFISVLFEKLTKENVFPPIIGMWLPEAILLSIAIYLMVKANNDAPLFNSKAMQYVGAKIKLLISKLKPIAKVK